MEKVKQKNWGEMQEELMIGLFVIYKFSHTNDYKGLC